MQSIVVHPENAEQLKAVKVQFEPQPVAVPKHVLEGIHRGLDQAKSGQTISLQEFKEKHFTKKRILK